jgi:glycerol uptake facilitator-like aquaporin
MFAPISGAHFNPAVSLVMTMLGALPPTELALYVISQLVGALLGAWLANAMFDLPVLQLSEKVRAGTGQWIAEAVATAGLLIVILRASAARVAAMVAAYIEPRTGSRRLRLSRIPLRRSEGCSVTASQESRHPQFRSSC